MSSSAMYVAKTGLAAQQTRMQVISNNLANVNTVGFKSDRVNFESLLYQISRSGGDQTSEDTALTSSLALGTGVRAVSTEKKFSQGSMITTDNALDVAVDGDGFFQILMPDGNIGYTRNGTFSRNADGLMTTSSGYVLQPQITIPSGSSKKVEILNTGRDIISEKLVSSPSHFEEEPDDIVQMGDISCS